MYGDQFRFSVKVIDPTSISMINNYIWFTEGLGHKDPDTSKPKKYQIRLEFLRTSVL